MREKILISNKNVLDVLNDYKTSYQLEKNLKVLQVGVPFAVECGEQILIQNYVIIGSITLKESDAHYSGLIIITIYLALNNKLLYLYTIATCKKYFQNNTLINY